MSLRRAGSVGGAQRLKDERGCRHGPKQGLGLQPQNDGTAGASPTRRLRDGMTSSAPVGRSRHVVTSAMGVTLILAWGSSYYLSAVLAAPIARDTGWPLPWVVSGLSVGLLVSGLCAPIVGRVVQQQGGRLVLAAGSLLLASGLVSLALAPSLAIFLGAWVVMGAGMSAGLYDAAFAVVGRLYGRAARGPITTLTLWAGFASTLCWPLSAWLVEAHGWRNACLAYAAVHLLIRLPLHLTLIPRLGSAGLVVGPALITPDLQTKEYNALQRLMFYSSPRFSP